MISRKGVVAQLLPALVVPLFLIIMVAIYSNFSTSIDRGDFTADANATFTDINNGTWDGYQLAALLPYIIVAMIVLSLIIGAVVFRGM
jgi:hypothetical protein